MTGLSVPIGGGLRSYVKQLITMGLDKVIDTRGDISTVVPPSANGFVAMLARTMLLEISVVRFTFSTFQLLFLAGFRPANLLVRFLKAFGYAATSRAESFPSMTPYRMTLPVVSDLD